MGIEEFTKSLKFVYSGEHNLFVELPVLSEHQFCIKYKIISSTYLLGEWEVGQILINYNNSNNFELLPLANSLLNNTVRSYVWNKETYVNSYAFKLEIRNHLTNQLWQEY